MRPPRRRNASPPRVRFRAEVPGATEVSSTRSVSRRQRYGGMPNSAFVIGKDGKIAAAMPWASVREVEAALVRLAGREPVAPTHPPDLGVIATQLQAAKRSGKPVLVQFTTPGCRACKAMHEQTLQDPEGATSARGLRARCSSASSTTRTGRCSIRSTSRPPPHSWSSPPTAASARACRDSREPGRLARRAGEVAA